VATASVGFVAGTREVQTRDRPSSPLRQTVPVRSEPDAEEAFRIQERDREMDEVEVRPKPIGCVHQLADQHRASEAIFDHLGDLTEIARIAEARDLRNHSDVQRPAPKGLCHLPSQR
jgi:hypothetical protein